MFACSGSHGQQAVNVGELLTRLVTPDRELMGGLAQVSAALSRVHHQTAFIPGHGPGPHHGWDACEMWPASHLSCKQSTIFAPLAPLTTDVLASCDLTALLTIQDLLTLLALAALLTLLITQLS